MTIQQRETGTLIGSDKVEGTAVFGSDSQKIGSIERMMIDKFSGKVSYAVLSFGGFLGIGDDHYPLPWKSLKYDTQLGGYITGSRKPSSRARRNIKMTTPGIGPTPPAPARWTSTTVSPSDAGATWDKPPPTGSLSSPPVNTIVHKSLSYLRYFRMSRLKSDSPNFGNKSTLYLSPAGDETGAGD